MLRKAVKMLGLKSGTVHFFPIFWSYMLRAYNRNRKNIGDSPAMGPPNRMSPTRVLSELREMAALLFRSLATIRNERRHLFL